MARGENESRKFARITRLVQKRRRIFAELECKAGTFPSTRHCAGDAVNDVTVSCSNHYLGMGPHPTVIAAAGEGSARFYAADCDDVMLEQPGAPARGYGQSKLAQVSMTVELAPSFAEQGITMISLHPSQP